MRREHDLLGYRKLPDDVYYGIQTLRAVENFPITGLRVHPALLKALALVKRAAALANMEIGMLAPHIGEAIVAACREIEEGQLLDQFVTDPIQGGAGTSINMNMNEVVANRAIELLGGRRGDYLLVHPNTHVNMSQSTNDVIPTAVRLALLRILDGTVPALNALSEEFSRLAGRYDSVVKLGRTHLQDAVPIRIGQEFAAYARVILRDAERIEKSRDCLLTVNMGATAVGTGLNADPEYIEKVLSHLKALSGYDFVGAEDLVDATQNVDHLVAVSAAFKSAAVNLSKIASDLRLMASGPRGGLGEITVPPVQPGSSIMPGKINPVLAETVNQVAFQIVGSDVTVALAAQSGQLELNVMQPVLIHNLLHSADMLRNVVTVFREKCVQGIVVNVERCQEHLAKSVGIVTALSPHIGYDKASLVAKAALEQNRSVAEIVLEKGILTEEELAIILRPRELTEPGIAGRELWDKGRGK
ncbi:MAG: aspartate ammonia-lyase [Firmicutes bacterium]|nr:aspartate ammonia-lyase [Bacillota bacterium]